MKSPVTSDIRLGFILVCTNKSEEFMINNLIFPQSAAYGHRIFAIRPNDYVFLYNLDTDILYGTFVAEAEGQYDPNLPLFNRKYPYYVKVKVLDEIKQLKHAKSFLRKLGISWKDYLTQI